MVMFTIVVMRMKFNPELLFNAVLIRFLTAINIKIREMKNIKFKKYINMLELNSFSLIKLKAKSPELVLIAKSFCFREME